MYTVFVFGYHRVYPVKQNNKTMYLKICIEFLFLKVNIDFEKSTVYDLIIRKMLSY